MTLGTQVQKYRLAAGLSYPALPELSGVEVGTLNALEKRKSKRSEHGPAIARAMGLTLEQLLDADHDHTSHIKAHLVKRYPSGPHSKPLTATESTAAPWGSPPWPFAAIAPERFRATLDPDDVIRIETYILAIIETREAEALKNAA